MKRLLCLLIFALLLPAGALASEEIALLEELSVTPLVQQPGLRTYRVEVMTETISEMLGAMTANIPENMPRPKTPKIVKYWSADPSGSVFIAEGSETFPYMQEMVDRFSSELAVNINSFFLPPSKAQARAKRLEGTRLSKSSMELGESLIQSVSIEFPSPASLDGAFYGEGLELPQDGIVKLRFDIARDPLRIIRMDIFLADGQPRMLEMRFTRREDDLLPEEIRISNPAGSIDDRFYMRFASVSGFMLPTEQRRVLNRSGAKEEMLVEFRDYAVNEPLPGSVLKKIQLSR